MRNLVLCPKSFDMFSGSLCLIELADRFEPKVVMQLNVITLIDGEKQVQQKNDIHEFRIAKYAIRTSGTQY